MATNYPPNLKFCGEICSRNYTGMREFAKKLPAGRPRAIFKISRLPKGNFLRRIPDCQCNFLQILTNFLQPDWKNHKIFDQIPVSIVKVPLGQVGGEILKLPAPSGQFVNKLPSIISRFPGKFPGPSEFGVEIMFWWVNSPRNFPRL